MRKEGGGGGAIQCRGRRGGWREMGREGQERGD